MKNLKEVLTEDLAENFFTQILLKKTTANMIAVNSVNIEVNLR